MLNLRTPAPAPAPTPSRRNISPLPREITEPPTPQQQVAPTPTQAPQEHADKGKEDPKLAQYQTHEIQPNKTKSNSKCNIFETHYQQIMNIYLAHIQRFKKKYEKIFLQFGII